MGISAGAAGAAGGDRASPEGLTFLLETFERWAGCILYDAKKKEEQEEENPSMPSSLGRPAGGWLFLVLFLCCVD